MPEPQQIAQNLPSGRRLTPQRRLVYDTLAGVTSHPDAEQLIALVRQRDASISVATVYNTLRILADAGWVRELRGLGPKTRYDANTGDHDHFTCRVCGTVEDIPAQHSGPLALRGDGFDRYRVDEVRVHALGCCASCAG
ncbi:MAG TPA: Fur family transcriptional regulator [Candidatus Dormibacteraeota bacterium]|nr:Fur family transcriptional regulator [Candidatus Dormibacteraeota bacterium]